MLRRKIPDLFSLGARRYAARVRRIGEMGIQSLTAFCAFLTIAITLLLFTSLLVGSIRYYSMPVATDASAKLNWFTDAGQLAWWPLIRNSLSVTLISIGFAAPIGTCAALYIGEFAMPIPRGRMMTVIELLHSMPSIIWAALAAVCFAPVLNRHMPDSRWTGFLLSCMTISAMLLPTIIWLAIAVLKLVPTNIRHSAFALGSSTNDVVRCVVLPAATQGLFAAVLIAAVRAFGEAMIVLVALDFAGVSNATLPTTAETASTAILRTLESPAALDSPLLQSISVLGLLLFLITYLTNTAAFTMLRRIAKKYSRSYE